MWPRLLEVDPRDLRQDVDATRGNTKLKADPGRSEFIFGQTVQGGAKVAERSKDTRCVLVAGLHPDVEILRGPRMSMDAHGVAPHDQEAGVHREQRLQQVEKIGDHFAPAASEKTSTLSCQMNSARLLSGMRSQ